MTREEIIKIFEENHIAEGNATINATKLAEIFTKHETDLLKEFVEWEYARYKGQGLSMIADDFAFAIKQDLEEFLEGARE